jgi:hypothetical protein
MDKASKQYPKMYLYINRIYYSINANTGESKLEKPTICKQDLIDKGQRKIYTGIVVIVLSPILGSLSFLLYVRFVGRMISTDGQVEMLWFSSIVATAVLGIATVLVGCNEKAIGYRSDVNS